MEGRIHSELGAYMTEQLVQRGHIGQGLGGFEMHPHEEEPGGIVTDDIAELLGIQDVAPGLVQKARNPMHNTLGIATRQRQYEFALPRHINGLHAQIVGRRAHGSTPATMNSTPQPQTAWTQRSRTLGELLGRCGLGDRAAFTELYRLTSAPLLGVVLRIQSDRAVAEDVLQGVFVNVWRHAAGFKAAQSQPMTWLTSIARNRAIDSLRRAQAQPHTVSVHRADDDDEGETLLDQQPDEAEGPLALLSRAADARQLHACMNHLSAVQRQSVALAFFDGLSHSEVALHMGQPLGTVKSWVRRALSSLKVCLDNATERDSSAGGK